MRFFIVFISNKKENLQYSCGHIQSCTDFIFLLLLSLRVLQHLSNSTLKCSQHENKARRYDDVWVTLSFSSPSFRASPTAAAQVFPTGFLHFFSLHAHTYYWLIQWCARSVLVMKLKSHCRSESELKLTLRLFDIILLFRQETCLWSLETFFAGSMWNRIEGFKSESSCRKVASVCWE